MAKKLPRQPSLDVDREVEAEDTSENRKRLRQGDQNRPTCPFCSKEGEPVFLTAVGATADGSHTWYACPNRDKCGCPRQKKARPTFLARERYRQAMRRQRHDPPDIGAR